MIEVGLAFLVALLVFWCLALTMIVASMKRENEKRIVESGERRRAPRPALAEDDYDGGLPDMPKSRCEARQYSDQMECFACGLIWDMNDPEPPQCLPLPSRRVRNAVESQESPEAEAYRKESGR